MADDGFQSVDSLVRASHGEEVDEESVEGKFKQKHKKIKIKELERQTQDRAKELGVPYMDLFGYPTSSEAISLIEQEEAKNLGMVCFYYDGKTIRIGSINPKKKEVKQKLEELKKEYHISGKLYLISSHSFNYTLEIYDSLPTIDRVEGGVKIEEEDLRRFRDDIKDYRSLNKKLRQVNTSDIVTLILATALKTGASDIHIEAEELSIAIRYRIDGVLQEAASIDKGEWKKIISRLKLLADAKINITERPQDGRFSIFLDDEKIEIRASFLPTNYGESVAMRVLRSSAINLEMKELGLRQEYQDILKKEMLKPHGLILTTGPTGSGKTTTLYTVLKRINNSENKIITLENPVEYQLEGISQSQIDESEDYSFVNALASCLRQDPDVVMVGEIRNFKTAETAIQAGLTGHLVLSTLHTNDASGVLPRIIDMGVKPYFLTPAINAIIGQRLARRLCQECKQEHKLTQEEKKEEKMDCRVSIISGGYGETVVIRVLANQAASLDFKKLGMNPYTASQVKNSMKKTKGIIINTGPTGSGKTTTLYAILNKLNTADVKIITVEDPIEYHMEGIIQTQVSSKEGWTFAKAMRSLLRQNPNIMMIGEIRDKETAAIAIEASLTGHLVLSTIHANSAAGAITRFSGLGIEKQQLANSLNCTIGQRLVRRNCPYCKQEVEISSDDKKQIENIIEKINPQVRKKWAQKELKFYKGQGCEKCNNIGYKGRLGIYETIENKLDIPKSIQKSDITNKEIEELAIKNKSVTMVQDGLIKALQGETSIDEVFRVIKE